jgi:hypothetical protein
MSATENQRTHGGRRDLSAVLQDHQAELMSVPGVVGIYEGLLPDESSRCLKVMVVKRTPELLGKIPGSLEGYPVLIEETGLIRPMR